MRNGLMLRYAAEDDFGLPESAFLACQFWYIDALSSIGRSEEARDLFNELLKHRNAFGMPSEDLHPATGQLWGNIPQTYSMAGLINSAMTLSRRWEDAWSGSSTRQDGRTASAPGRTDLDPSPAQQDLSRGSLDLN
jgi:GH15 family glucan-1,4-alpha-glucosidase